MIFRKKNRKKIFPLLSRSKAELIALLYKTLKKGMFPDEIRNPNVLYLAQKERLLPYLNNEQSTLNNSQTMILKNLGKIAGDLGIRVIVFQGCGLWGTVYQHPHLRPIGDIDIYIQKKWRTKLIEFFKSEGFELLNKKAGIFYRKQLALDIHTDFFGFDRVKSRRFANKLDSTSVEQRSIVHPLASGLLIPDLIDHFIILALHCQKHNYSRVIWLLDLALVLKKIINENKFEELRRRSEESEVATNIAIVLLSLRYHFKIRNPAIAKFLTENLPLLSKAERKAAYNLLRLNSKTWSNEKITLSKMKNPLEKTIYLLESLFPKPTIITTMYGLPKMLLPLCYCIRVVDLLFMLARKIFAGNKEI